MTWRETPRLGSFARRSTSFASYKKLVESFIPMEEPTPEERESLDDDSNDYVSEEEFLAILDGTKTSEPNGTGDSKRARMRASKRQLRIVLDRLEEVKIELLKLRASLLPEENLTPSEMKELDKSRLEVERGHFKGVDDLLKEQKSTKVGLE